MLASYKWLTEIAGFAPPPQELSDRFTFSGLEVDSLTHRGPEFENIVVAEVLSRTPHPKRANLNLVEVNDGAGVTHVVCGAANCPAAGGRVVLAKLGARVGDIVIAPRELAGAPSEGMLCSEAELGIGTEDEGILILNEITDAAPGTPISTALGLEDWIFELGVTPNRPDALSHDGLAREMCLLYNRPFAPQPLRAVSPLGAACSASIEIKIENSKACRRYSAAIVRGVTVKPSPFSIRYRLHNLGIRPISNLVDITNAILLQTGQPLHAFDLDRLPKPQIEVRSARAGETMKTLDNAERKLSETDLLICSGGTPVAVAGVMGGLESEICATTTNILIECANFDPSSIRRTAKRLKLSSESSYRFERGVDPLHTERVLAATVAAVCEVAGGAPAPGIVDVVPSPIQPLIVRLRPARFTHIMGYAMSEKDMIRILEGLGAAVTPEGDALNVQVPTARPDIEREIDLIEELARINGLEKVPSQLPRIQCLIPQRAEFETIRRTKETLIAAGLEESVSYSFVPITILEALQQNTRVVQIANPLNSERDAMRTTLIAGLLENLKRSQSRYGTALAQFEVGRTFHDRPGEELPEEVLRVAGIYAGPRPGWPSSGAETFDFFDAKGAVELLCQGLSGRSPVMTPVRDVPWLHPGKALSVSVEGTTVGLVGEIHPAVLDGLKLPRGVVGFELELLPIGAARVPSRAVPLSDFPPMGRDVAFLAADTQDTAPIAAALKDAAGPLAVDVRLFDIYRGKGIEPGKKSIAYSVQYRSFERTLTDEEVDTLHRKAVDAVCAQFALSVR